MHEDKRRSCGDGAERERERERESQISTDTWKLEDINYQHLLLALIIQT